jgi:hypothetical protein
VDLLAEDIPSVVGHSRNRDTSCFASFQIGWLVRSPQRQHIFVNHDLRSGWSSGSPTPGTDGVSAALAPRLRHWREILSVRGPSYEYAERGTGEDIKGVVAGVHNASTGDESGAERGNHDHESPPHFTLGIQDMQLRSEV